MPFSTIDQSQLENRTTVNSSLCTSTLPSRCLLCYSTLSQLWTGWRNMLMCFLCLRDKSSHDLVHSWLRYSKEWCEFIDISIRLHQSVRVNLFIFHSSQMSTKDINDFFSPFHWDAMAISGFLALKVMHWPFP